MINLPAPLRLQIEAWLRDIFGRFMILSEHRLFFFGSRVGAIEPSTSDIDIGIRRHDGQALPEGILAQIKEEISILPTLYKIDIVDFGAAAPEFKEVAMQQTEDFAS